MSIKSIPTELIPLKNIPVIYDDKEYVIEAIVGTAILKQFLTTINYEDANMIFRKKDSYTLDEVLKVYKNSYYEDIPFYLEGSHSLLIKGQINGRNGMLFRIDSGLAGNSIGSLPIQTLNYLNIPEPKKTHQGEGGGGMFKIGTISIDEFGIGSQLNQYNVNFSYGDLTPETYWMNKFIQDGIISHQFLRNYTWTIDFTSMKILFTK